MATAPDVPAWTITQQQETTDLGPAGTYVTGIKVTFRTATGQVGSVFVASSDYTVPNVSAAVSARAAIVDAVQGLQG